MISELLVCLDGSSRSVEALTVAAALAPAMHAAVSVATVTEPGSDTWSDRTWLDERCTEARVQPHRRLVVPAEDTVEALVALAEAEGTVLCLTSHGHTGLLDDALGSVAAGVIARSLGPVLVVGPRAMAPSRFDVVQLCLDGPVPAHRAVACAVAWCRRLFATPWLVTVVPPDVVLRLGETAGLAALEGAIRTMQDEGLEPEWEVLHDDDVADALAESAAKLEAALIVAGTHGRSGLGQTILGSIAGGLVRRATCPVLLVGPDAGR